MSPYLDVVNTENHLNIRVLKTFKLEIKGPRHFGQIHRSFTLPYKHKVEYDRTASATETADPVPLGRDIAVAITPVANNLLEVDAQGNIVGANTLQPCGVAQVSSEWFYKDP